jgi:hypothetical protein
MSLRTFLPVLRRSPVVFPVADDKKPFGSMSPLFRPKSSRGIMPHQPAPSPQLPKITDSMSRALQESMSPEILPGSETAWSWSISPSRPEIRTEKSTFVYEMMCRAEKENRKTKSCGEP